jgi:histidine triad (HIT) family protein
MSLAGAYDDANIFAKILRGEIACTKVFEDEIALSFMDLFPQSRGHTLVIPKGVKARNFLDLPPETVGPFMQRVQRVARAVEKALQPDGVMIAQMSGAPAGQTVFHVHFHIIPRYEGQSTAMHAHGRQADAAELQEIAGLIAAAL